MFKYFFLGVTALLLIACSTTKEQTGSTGQVTLIQSSRSGDNLKTYPARPWSAKGAQTTGVIRISPEISYQTLTGFGGSFTESSAYVLNQLSPAQRQRVIDAYFSPAGSAYSLTRTHINSCDFSLDHYAYTIPDDEDLLSFSVAPDMDDLIPLIQDAQKVPGASFKIIASPWTAPPWMKDNNSYYAGSLKPEYQPVWAKYFSKYLEAYKAQGISIWGITPENEPMGNGGNWDSMEFTPESMNTFIREHLGPRLREDGWDTEILIFDQNRDHVEEWTDVILSDPETAKYVWGTAVHWYSSTIDWYPETLTKVHEKFPDKHILHSEGCIDTEVPVWQDDAWYWSKEATDWGYTWASEADKPKHPKYSPVYRYARDIIGGLNSWLTGWVDWNLVLDTQGGPNLASNWCIAPVIAKPETDEVYFTPLYYTLAHFSKYFRPGAQRIAVSSDLKDLMVTACKNPDGKIAVAVLNQQELAVDYALQLGDREVQMLIPAAALQTLILE